LLNCQYGVNQTLFCKREFLKRAHTRGSRKVWYKKRTGSKERTKVFTESLLELQ